MIGGVRILTQQTTRRLCRTFFPVIFFSSCNWCVCILTWQTVIWDLFQPLVKWLYLFFFGCNFFGWFEKHSWPDNCTFFWGGRNFSGGSKNIAGQTTVPSFFWVIIFSGCNWCSYFDMSTNYGTYTQPEKITTRKKVQSNKARKKHTLTKSLDLIVSVKWRNPIRFF